jgi:hypothetical protein
LDFFLFLSVSFFTAFSFGGGVGAENADLRAAEGSADRVLAAGPLLDTLLLLRLRFVWVSLFFLRFCVSASIWIRMAV